ncbi:MAG: tyrosine-type recombinase/integrase [Bacteroidales bacterium]|nr:tyrosine-type recombinase/integrase [Bacteroidales bacterium]
MPKSNAKRADGRYQRLVTIGTDPDGKRIRKVVYGKTEKEVRKKADELKVLLGKGIDVTTQRDTFAVWAERWLKTKTCGTGQLNAYKSCLNHWLPRIGDEPISALKFTDLQLAMMDIVQENELSEKTMKMIAQTASQIMELAVDNYVIDRNPARKLKPPADSLEAVELEPLTDEQIIMILDTPHRVRIAALTMLLCGLRRGEMAALRRSDVGLEKGELYVRRTVDMQSGKAREKRGGKTKNAVRVVPIPAILKAELTAHFQQQDARTIRPIDPLVFPQATAEKAHSNTSWTRAWNSYLCDLNVKYGYPGQNVTKFQPGGLPMRISRFTAQNLRHTYATLLYEADVKVITAQHRLGHSKASVTLDVYTHLRNQKKSLGNERVQEIIAEMRAV